MRWWGWGGGEGSDRALSHLNFFPCNPEMVNSEVCFGKVVCAGRKGYRGSRCLSMNEMPPNDKE